MKLLRKIIEIKYFLSELINKKNNIGIDNIPSLIDKYKKPESKTFISVMVAFVEK